MPRPKSRRDRVIEVLQGGKADFQYKSRCKGIFHVTITFYIPSIRGITIFGGGGSRYTPISRGGGGGGWGGFLPTATFAFLSQPLSCGKIPSSTRTATTNLRNIKDAIKTPRKFFAIAKPAAKPDECDCSSFRTRRRLLRASDANMRTRSVQMIPMHEPRLLLRRRAQVAADTGLNDFDLDTSLIQNSAISQCLSNILECANSGSGRQSVAVCHVSAILECGADDRFVQLFALLYV